MAQFCLILFGPPGSGKGTQAALLRDRLELAHISTGEILRARIVSGDELGRRAEAYMNSGALVPDEMVNQSVEDRVQHPDSARGFILDGYPRTVTQAKLLDEMLKARGICSVVVHLRVSYNEVIARLSARRQCASCGTLSNESSGEVCAKCGSKMALRDDDRPEVVMQRLQAYDLQTKPVLEYFRAAGYPIFEVEAGSRAPQEIAEEIEHAMEAELGAANVRTA
ncbi:MAG TPA: adenylate kinase [Bryobacteraceae bacterium]|nr:adenylate kinase [Bryobacteraceae bacterium]